MKETIDLPHSQNQFTYIFSIENCYLLFIALIYIAVSMLSLRWILANSIMNAFQKSIHILMVLFLPVIWLYLLSMIYKPIPGYKKRQWFDNGTNGESGGFDYYSSGDTASDGGSDGD